MEKKITKKQVFGVIIEDLEARAVEKIGDVDVAAILDVLKSQIAQIDAKAEKAKERAKEKKSEGDEFRAHIAGLLTDEFQTAEDILAQVDMEQFAEATKAKITARLSQLVNAEVAEKEQVKVGDRRLMGYKLKGIAADAEVEGEDVAADTE